MVYGRKENTGFLFRRRIVAVQNDTFQRIIVAVTKMSYYTETCGGY